MRSAPGGETELKVCVCQCWSFVDAGKVWADWGKATAKSCIKDRLDTQTLNTPPNGVTPTPLKDFISEPSLMNFSAIWFFSCQGYWQVFCIIRFDIDVFLLQWYLFFEAAIFTGVIYLLANFVSYCTGWNSIVTIDTTAKSGSIIAFSPNWGFIILSICLSIIISGIWSWIAQRDYHTWIFRSLKCTDLDHLKGTAWGRCFFSWR